jgi:hypothetical protein
VRQCLVELDITCYGAGRRLVIAWLTRLIDDANIAPMQVRFAVARRMILWYFGEYFDRLGGDVLATNVVHDTETSIARS